MANIENSICEAIELIVDKTVSEAGYNKTIQGIVQKCEDAAIGKYKIKYQDSTFYAYSTNPENNYNEGSLVYILIPNNNMEQNKTILGTVDHLGTEYMPVINNEEQYHIIGKNCLISSQEYQLSSYSKNYIKHIYLANEPEKSSIQLDIEGLNKYLKEAQLLICSACVQTKMEIKQQTKGNYGIIFGIDFSDNSTQKTVTRYYTIDVNNMIGNPYKLNLEKRQVGVFTIDGANFQKISSISLFVKDFPLIKKSSEIEEQKLFDINISKLELMGAVPVSDTELQTCGLYISTPNGTIFSKKLDTSMPIESLKIIADVRIKGKSINTDEQNLPFYWFRENAAIDRYSEKYNQIGGCGWECLNPFTKIENDSYQEWSPGKSFYDVKIQEVPAKEVRFKCIVKYHENLYSQKFTITNNLSEVKIYIQSDKGTQFYYDAGDPTLTCIVEGVPKERQPFTYVWGKTDSYGIFTNLNTIDNKDEHIENHQIKNIAINKITNFVTYHCSIYDKDKIFLGSSNIVLSNSLHSQEGYHLSIDNGVQLFQYDEYGNSPTNPSLLQPQTIPALTFTILDNLGRPLTNLASCEVLWKIPVKNSFLNIKDITIDKTDEKFYYVKNLLTLSYSLKPRYSYSYINNNIELEVKYKGITLTTTTNFTFMKSGDIGTNGTNFTCKIVPNNEDNNFNQLPTFTVYSQDKSKGYFNFKYGKKQTNILTSDFSEEAPFKIQIFESGKKVFDNFESQIDANNTDNNILVTWEFLRNQYTKEQSDTGYFNIVKNSDNLTNIKNNDTIISKKSGTMSYSYLDIKYKSLAHILKCTVQYKHMTLFATLPILFVEMETDLDTTISLKPYTGFNYITYTSDGTNPQYNDTYPFELMCIKKGIKQELKDYIIQWKCIGKVYNYHNMSVFDDTKIFIDTNELIPIKSKNNTFFVKPIDRYTGLCVTNAIVAEVKGLGKIHIPIHMYLNKHGLSYLNNWDGNSIQLNEDGGFILSPQIGAGIKNTDNSFTGMVMGEVQHPNKENIEIGLFGYNKGLQTLKIDAETGAAIFGPQQGQLIIDPTAQKAMLYSHDYWKEYTEKGLPKSYTQDNINRLTETDPNSGIGAMINFSAKANNEEVDSFIDFANGNFNLTALGELKANKATFDKDCQFKGNINTLAHAYIGGRLFLATETDINSQKTIESGITLGEVQELENFKQQRKEYKKFYEEEYKKDSFWDGIDITDYSQSKKVSAINQKTKELLNYNVAIFSLNIPKIIDKESIKRVKAEIEKIPNQPTLKQDFQNEINTYYNNILNTYKIVIGSSNSVSIYTPSEIDKKSINEIFNNQMDEINKNSFAMIKKYRKKYKLNLVYNNIYTRFQQDTLNQLLQTSEQFQKDYNTYQELELSFYNQESLANIDKIRKALDTEATRLVQLYGAQGLMLQNRDESLCLYIIDPSTLDEGEKNILSITKNKPYITFQEDTTKWYSPLHQLALGTGTGALTFLYNDNSFGFSGDGIVRLSGGESMGVLIESGVESDINQFYNSQIKLSPSLGIEIRCPHLYVNNKKGLTGTFLIKKELTVEQGLVVGVK